MRVGPEEKAVLRQIVNALELDISPEVATKLESEQATLARQNFTH